MSPEGEREIYEAMRAAREAARGYADFFGWAPDRDLEEQSIVGHLAESLEATDVAGFTEIKRRGRGNDPPDVEAVDGDGRRLAIEVTELVDGNAIKAFKAGRHYDWAEWTQTKFLSSLMSLLEAKNARFPKLKDGPYPGGYMVLVFTDEPELQRATVERFLAEHTFPPLPNVNRAILLLSYDPGLGRCPYFELVNNG